MSDTKQTYCGATRGHLGHPNDDGSVCGGYPPSQADRQYLAEGSPTPEPEGAADPSSPQLHLAANPMPAGVPVQVTEWWFTLRHETPELDCPVTGKTWALQGSVMGGLVALPPIMMCINCGAALVLVGNGPTPPEEVKPMGAGPSDVV